MTRQRRNSSSSATHNTERADLESEQRAEQNRRQGKPEQSDGDDPLSRQITGSPAVANATPLNSAAASRVTLGKKPPLLQPPDGIGCTLAQQRPASGRRSLLVQAILAGEELIFGCTLECPHGGAADAASLGGLALIVIGFGLACRAGALRHASKDGRAS